MAPDEQGETAAADADAPAEDAPGVFGNLPKTRPGARSPRRESGEARASAAAAKPPAPKRTSAPTPPPRAPTASAEKPAEAPTPHQQSGGIEDVAWAGVAAAAEAATIGVRLANRALEAMRDAVDRR
jgi:hypothetical protein